MKYAWIAMHKARWPITLACDVLGVSASGYFEHWRRKDASKPSQLGATGASATKPCWFTSRPSTLRSSRNTAGPRCGKNCWPGAFGYIRLKERVESRMMIADVTATGDDNVLSAQSNDVAYRKEQLRRLQEEVIEMEDLKTGVSITDLGLNDFRMDLLNYVKANGDLSRLPNGLHAVVPADVEKGLLPGVIFTLRNRVLNGTVGSSPLPIQQKNRLHPYYLVYIGMDGTMIADHTEVKNLLDLARTACKDRVDPVPAVFEPFNKATDDGRNMQVYSTLLDQAIHSMVERQQEQEVDSLFSPGKTSALTQNLTGIEDFELVSFLVIQSV